jgi:hypothetical protein
MTIEYEIARKLWISKKNINAWIPGYYITYTVLYLYHSIFRYIQAYNYTCSHLLHLYSLCLLLYCTDLAYSHQYLKIDVTKILWYTSTEVIFSHNVLQSSIVCGNVESSTCIGAAFCENCLALLIFVLIFSLRLFMVELMN